MKKSFFILMAIIGAVLFTNVTCLAEVTGPEYDETFNGGNGALYANGRNITITEDETLGTVVTWDGGSQAVPDTVTIFGGGPAGSNYEEVVIAMESGTVDSIVAGGVSTEEENPSNVNNSEIILNGGTVSNKISGGGYLYSTVDNSKITINGGSVSCINGGGFASTLGQQVGDEDNPEESPNRTNNVEIVINDGTIDPTKYEDGLIYGGGQGISYTGNSKITINGGNLENAVLTAGGSNGYTGSSDITINDGTIDLYQSVNRGIVDSAKVTLNDGTINNLYVGGETEAADVDGKVNSSGVYLLGGTVNKLESGTSEGTPIVLDDDNFQVVETEDATVVDDEIPGRKITLNYDIAIIPDEATIYEGDERKLQAVITTTPAGYEDLFNNIKWESSNPEVATVSEDGVVTGVKGDNEAVITASVQNKQATAKISVRKQSENPAIWIALGILISLLLLLLIAGVLAVIGSLG